VMIWINLGAAYLDRPPYTTTEGEEKAIIAFTRALELDPKAVSVSYNLGLIYNDRGDVEQALCHFEQAIRTNPGDIHARLWRDRLIAEQQVGQNGNEAEEGNETSP
jgi:tetratricopeptide (TPR) repeat protein